MLGVLDFLGTVGGNILSLPGILGVAVGMMTRSWALAALMGAAVGLGQSLLFSGFDMATLPLFELGIAIGVGVIAALLGCVTRRLGVAA